MYEKGPSKNAKAIVSGLWLVIATVLMLHFLEIKTTIDGIAQDYPSFGLNLISKWAPLFFPLPSAYYLLRERFLTQRVKLDLIFGLIILSILASIIKIYFTKSISWELFWNDLRWYFLYIFMGSFLALDKPKFLVGKLVDQVKGWSDLNP